ncbi:MAG TPA: DinB family protein [Longimicrobiales bacterium]|nr:DinB family protein [Longimicrobiales bacterium]
MEITTTAGFLAWYDSIARRTTRVIDCIPDDAMEWRPGDGRFSFADLVRHLAALERWMFAENVAGRPSRYPGHGPELASGHAAVRAFYTQMRGESRAIFAALGDDDLQRRCVTPAGASLPVWKWLRAMVEHEVHHRGQLYLMLGIIGTPTPPMFGLTSEQVRENSITQATS